MEPMVPYPIQQTQIEHLANVLERCGTNRFCLSGNDTGTGKTLVGIEVCKARKERPIIIAPKAVLTSWKRTCARQGVQPYMVINIEMLKTGKVRLPNHNAPLLQKAVQYDGKRRYNTFQWGEIPTDSRIILDEAHVFGGKDSDTSKVLAILKGKHCPLGLSATLADSPLRLRAVGYLLGLHDFVDQSYIRWCLNHGIFTTGYKQLRFDPASPRGKQGMLRIHEHLFPKYGSRIRRADMPNAPEFEIIPTLVDPEESAEAVQEAYEECEKPPEYQGDSILVKILRARQLSEALKLRYMEYRIEDLLEEGLAVIVFVNFIESVNELVTRLKRHSPSVIIGQGHKKTQSLVGRCLDRDKEKDRFQNDTTRLIICTVSAGGTGIDLHDVHGYAPRHVLIAPPVSAIHLEQALGRAPRDGTKSKTSQEILCLAGTIEETIFDRVMNKRENIGILNDGKLFAS